jgi:hypothetical protein
MPKRTKAQIEAGKEQIARLISLAEKPVTKATSYKERLAILHSRYFKEFLEITAAHKARKSALRKKSASRKKATGA